MHQWTAGWVLAMVFGGPAADLPCNKCVVGSPVPPGSAGGFASKIFDTSDFPPRWYCGSWTQIHGWLHIVSDLLVWSAYLAIPIALIYFVRKRSDVPFTPLFWLFGGFILACGTTHFMEAVIFWWPAYRLAGMIKLATGVISWVTVLVLLPVIPKALRLKSPEQLEKEVTQRTRELRNKTTELAASNKELEQARQMAEVATKAKSSFLANMSHEIRTPMTAILGYSELLMESVQRLDPQTQAVEAVHTIKRNGEHLLAIINDILDISKIEAGKLTPEVVAYSPTDVMNEVVSLLSVRANSKNITCSFDIEGSIPSRIMTDPLRLRQIILNLAGNSIKFTDRGEVRVVARHLGGAEPKLQFDVIDTGIGMTEEQATSLFQPFTQADNSMARHFGGTGLGLSISKKLSELLGGDLEIVTTKPGEGTTMRVTINAGTVEDAIMVSSLYGVSEQEVVVSRDSGAAPVEKPDEKTLAGVTILLAEDGADNQMLLSRFLRGCGAEVKIVDNGRAAVECAMHAIDAGAMFDLILMDIQMPVMDGYDATKTLRARGYKRPIVALTAHAMEGEKEKCTEAGFNGHLTKPISKTNLVRGVERYVRAIDRAAFGV